MAEHFTVLYPGTVPSGNTINNLYLTPVAESVQHHRLGIRRIPEPAGMYMDLSSPLETQPTTTVSTTKPE
jgi:hypothetical protein